MPKSQLRFGRTIAWQGPRSDTSRSKGPIHGRFVLSTPRRKVSFEDKRSDSKSSICSDDTVLTKNSTGKQIINGKGSEREKSPVIRRKRSLLVRPITSLSLVDLARSVVENDSSSMTSGRDDEDFIEERKSKRTRSFSLSPRSVISKPNLSRTCKEQYLWSPRTSTVEESKSARTSPWGHFIDMVPDEDDNFQRAEYQNIDTMFKSYRRVAYRNSCYGLQSRVRRRPAQPAALNFVHLDEDLNVVHVMSRSRDCSRLQPRRQNSNDKLAADRLIGVFSELQLRQDERKTNGR
mmetsp:Transcript_9500/g.28324  ORF Transcript_9500/g.28324 Transcript_9500/m.28324 type:complete len:292 (-) Transcript_9500:163-1038(-)|eukprot:CAMPEP_0172368352 /NCGR_PEP_ID=MMETSP1060-20121228/26588_1 /TAXON_ID=37318 /ORGANISM="Pseudo-nitzschia pungens, Strain cf. cingulata" /LENGTH=291 /DNA_ID=CAMNT_0013092911 /DNA_START=138 /DNA_END=1013 /DNA_ORIENTATION=-